MNKKTAQRKEKHHCILHSQNVISKRQLENRQLTYGKEEVNCSFILLHTWKEHSVFLTPSDTKSCDLSVYASKSYQPLWLQTIFRKAELLRLSSNPSIFNLAALLETGEWLLGVICIPWKITLKSRDLQQHTFNSFPLFLSLTFFMSTMSCLKEIGIFLSQIKVCWQIIILRK